MFHWRNCWKSWRSEECIKDSSVYFLFSDSFCEVTWANRTHKLLIFCNYPWNPLKNRFIRFKISMICWKFYEIELFPFLEKRSFHKVIRTSPRLFPNHLQLTSVVFDSHQFTYILSSSCWERDHWDNFCFEFLL